MAPGGQTPRRHPAARPVTRPESKPRRHAPPAATASAAAGPDRCRSIGQAGGTKSGGCGGGEKKGVRGAWDEITAWLPRWRGGAEPWPWWIASTHGRGRHGRRARRSSPVPRPARTHERERAWFVACLAGVSPSAFRFNRPPGPKRKRWVRITRIPDGLVVVVTIAKLLPLKECNYRLRATKNDSRLTKSFSK